MADTQASTNQQSTVKLSMAAKDLTLGWNGKAVASQINLEILGGQITVLAGPNGAGKSTIVKAIARQIKPLSGNVLINGHDIWQCSAKAFAQQVAYVPQNLELGQDLTVAELAGLGRNPHQPWWSWRESKEDRLAIQEALDQTETSPIRHKYLSNLSGGEKQRALIACALVQQPKFLLLDEPTAHLDFRHQLELCQLLKELSRHGLGILVVLHDLNLMARLADQIVLLAKTNDSPSQIACTANPKEALTPAILRQVYQVEVGLVTDPASNTQIYMPMACSDDPI